MNVGLFSVYVRLFLQYMRGLFAVDIGIFPANVGLFFVCVEIFLEYIGYLHLYGFLHVYFG